MKVTIKECLSAEYHQPAKVEGVVIKEEHSNGRVVETFHVINGTSKDVRKEEWADRLFERANEC